MKGKTANLWKILGGDMLGSDFVRRQIPLVALIVVLTFFYIQNRYACQQKMLEVNRLTKELTDIKYDALTRSSELMELSRQSRIEQYINNTNSDLETSTTPPYVIP